MNFDLSTLFCDASGFIAASLAVWACIVGGVLLSGQAQAEPETPAPPANVARVRRNSPVMARSRQRRIKRATAVLLTMRQPEREARAS